MKTVITTSMLALLIATAPAALAAENANTKPLLSILFPSVFLGT